MLQIAFFELIIKLAFFGSLVGVVFIILNKAQAVKALLVEEEKSFSDSDILAWPSKIKNLGKEIGRVAPQKAKELVGKNKELVAKQFEAVKFFSGKKIIYQFKKIKPQVTKPEQSSTSSSEDQCNFDSDYWNKVQKQ
ncbi:MAG: hypothetical protein PHN39_01840 [Candidatus Pacebacteria bacterium]|nr:hypothetical protein [Candidatus Paceibacterota bacterium]